MVSKIYKPEYVNIREAFRHEAHIFTVSVNHNFTFWRGGEQKCCPYINPI